MNRPSLSVASSTSSLTMTTALLMSVLPEFLIMPVMYEVVPVFWMLSRFISTASRTSPVVTMSVVVAAAARMPPIDTTIPISVMATIMPEMAWLGWFFALRATCWM